MKKAIISIKGIQIPENDEKDVVELVTDGEYHHADGVAVFSYMESELTGLEGTKTTFEVKDDTVTLTREGAVNTRMVFCEGKKNYFAYETPFGAVTMGVNTHGVTAKLHDGGGNLEIHYLIDMDNTPISRNTFKINVKEC
ncbi:MAG: DUF1934 domain-containing protein [Oscillospiraceae bacterium]